MQVKKYLIWGGVAFAAYFLFARPAEAAQAVRGALNTVLNAADSLAHFVTSIA